MSPSKPCRIRISIVASLSVLAMVVPLRASGIADAPKPKGGVWLAGDLHVHTCFSHDAYCGPGDDNTGPEEAYTLGRTVEEQFCDASRRGLDFMAITDHNDIRSQKDSGWGACGVLPIPGYENSLQGHAQMLGATELYDSGDKLAAAVNAAAAELRADGGVFQINHPANGSVDWPNDPDWKYGYDVIPDTVETWNISTLWQPPAPSGSSNDDAIRYWEGWLDRGYHVGATGGSDNHYASTSAVQGPGQPTTWVYTADRSEEAILEGIREGRTTISHQPPELGGPRLFLEADADGDGTYESMVGDSVSPGAAMRVRVENAPGAEILLHSSGDEVSAPVKVIGPRFEYRFSGPADGRWIWAELIADDRPSERSACDPQLGDQTTYCRNRFLRLAMTSAIYLEHEVTDGESYMRVEEGRIVLGNALVERAWTTEPFATEYMLDKRNGLRTGAATDFWMWADESHQPILSEDFAVERVTASPVPAGGLTLRIQLRRDVPTSPFGFWPATGTVVRTFTVYPGIAGFEVRTSVQMDTVVEQYALGDVQLPGARPTSHSFRAGYDWRGSDSPNWEPTVSPLDGHHSGDHRVTVTRGPGGPLFEEGEWLSMATTSGATVFVVNERVDYTSSQVQYQNGTGRAFVNLAKDLIYAGPFESDVHVSGANWEGRVRSFSPDHPTDLEPLFIGFGLDADDEVWQHWKYLDRRQADWEPSVVFNSNGVDSNRISTGAKDDMDLSEVERQAAVAKRMGVETFVLDDGWQAASGDWCPDSPQCRDPRGTYPARFPDAEFDAVREAIAPMDLGLWMTPMMFNPASKAHADNPTWMCDPVGKGLYAYNTADPNGSSNEAGVVPWNPEATGPDGKLIDYIEGKIRHAIEDWKVRYFKFDFMVWLDCAGANPVTMYDYRESFIRMLDRLIDDFPSVTFQIDETNDYRLFPFESAYRGPSWYANGSPKASEALHNLWVLAPYVPSYTIGQTSIGQRDSLSIDYLMAAGMASHMTFFTDLTQLTEAQVDAVARWTQIYREHRDRFATFTYPLLEDPLPGNNWTGLQPWNSDTGEGALLVFRQDSPDATRSVALRGVRGGGSFVVTDAETGEPFGEFTASELRSGITITIPQRNSARVLLIDPV